MRRLRLVVVTSIALVAIGIAWWWNDWGSSDPSMPAGAGNPAAPATVAEHPPLPPPPASSSEAASGVPWSQPIEARWQHTFDRLAYGTRWQGPQPPELAAFREWTERFHAASSESERAALTAEGVALATVRRPVMRTLIEQSPERALGLTVPAAVRAALPVTVVAELETRVAGTGMFAVVPVEPDMDPPGAAGIEPDHDHVHDHDHATDHVATEDRFVSINGVTYAAHVYGRRRGQTTEEGASLHGITLDGQFAVHSSPVRVLEPGEETGAVIEAVDPTTGAAVVATALPRSVGAPTRVAFHGRTWALADPELLATLERHLRALEIVPGPVAPPFVPGVLVEPPMAEAAPTAWTTGTKRLLALRVDFPDVIGEPRDSYSNSTISQAFAQNILNNQVRPFFVEASYNQTTLNVTVSNKVYRMPKTAGTYAREYDLFGLYEDAVAAARSDHNADNFELVQIIFSNIGPSRFSDSKFGFAGVAFLGGKQSFINGFYLFDVVAHEIGHNYGLSHANLWQSYSDAISDYGSTQEYGDTYDVMGGYNGTTDRRYHFNPWFKNELGWLPDSAVTFAATSGTYRVHRFDAQNAPRTQPLALNVFRDGCRSYWIGLRRNVSGAMASSAYVQWGFHGMQQSQLLDIGTPGYDLSDAGLAVGVTLDDSANGVTLRTVSTGGVSPSEYLDIAVTVAPPARNIVAQWGEDEAVKVPPGLRDVIEMAAGDEHGIARKRNGELVVWGDRNPEGSNRFGELDIPWNAHYDVASIWAGGDSSAVIKTDGTIVVWGLEEFGQNNVPAGLNNVKQVGIGGDHMLALKHDGTVVGWGRNDLGQITLPAGLPAVQAISAGRDMSLLLLADGTVRHLGVNAAQMPAGLTGIIAVSAGWGHGLALRSNGTVVAWGENSDGQATVPAGLGNVKQIGAGHQHSVALKHDGTIVAWGNNDHRQASLPRGLPQVEKIAVAENHVLGLIEGTNAPVVTSHPMDQTTNFGGITSFYVSSDSPTPVTYRWQRRASGTTTWVDLVDGEDYSGVATSQLAVLRPTPEMSGDEFRCVVGNDSVTAATSQAARLTVNILPINISSGPHSPSVHSGQEANLWINAYNSTTFRWQRRSSDAGEWQDVVNGGSISGATTYNLHLGPVNYTWNGTQFRCWVGNGGYLPEVASDVATLTVVARALSFWTQPRDQEFVVHGSGALAVAAGGEGSLQFQWQRRPAGGDSWSDVVDGANYAGAQTGRLEIRNVPWSARGDSFRCVVMDEVHPAVVSEAARLSVRLGAPELLTFPSGVTATRGGGAMLSFGPDPDGSTIVAWRHNGTQIPGATGSVLQLSDLDDGDAGVYDAVIRDDEGDETVTYSVQLELQPAAYPNRMKVDPSFAPRFERTGGMVLDMTIAGDGTWYLAGDFTAVDGRQYRKVVRLLADGSVDESFNPDLPVQGQAYAVVAQADARVVVGGGFFLPEQNASRVIYRLNSDGTRDESFAASVAESGHVLDLAVQDDGKIIVAGFGLNIGGRAGDVLRLNADGTIDPTFEPTGYYSGFARSVLVQADGKVVVATEHQIRRFNTDGTVDSSFTPVSSMSGQFVALARQPDGRLLVGGEFAGVNETPMPGGLIRLDANGAVDTAFVRVPDEFSAVSAVATAGDRIIVVGRKPDYSESRIERLLADGTRDPAFALAAGIDSYVYFVGAVPQGRVVAGGQFKHVGGLERNGVVAIADDGTIDASWSISVRHAAEIHAIQPDLAGALIVGGNFTHVNGVPRLFVARLRSDGSLDESYAPDFPFEGGVHALLRLPDGRMMVGGATDGSYDPERRMLVRLLADGAPDLSFSSFEVYAGSGGAVRAFGLHPNGRILFAGDISFQSGGNHGNLIGRTRDDGSLDTSWKSIGSIFGNRVNVIALRSDGRLMVAGSVGASTVEVYNSGFASLLADGQPDYLMPLNRGIHGGEGNYAPEVHAMALLPEGRVLLGGSFAWFNDEPHHNIVRLLPDGTADPGFLTGEGIVGTVRALLPQSDDRVIVGGHFAAYDGTVCAPLIRLNPDGTRDVRFEIEDFNPLREASVQVITYEPDGDLVVGGGWLDIGEFRGGGLVRLKPAAPLPVVTALTEGATVSAGTGRTLTVSAQDDDGVTYQWQFNGGNIPGATAPTHTIGSAQEFHQGFYSVVLSNPGGSVASPGIDLAVTEPPPSGARLTNLSTRAVALTGDNVLIPGFVVEGPGNKQLLIRAVGPTLGGFGVAGTLPDPRLVLKRWNPALPPNGGYEDVETNDDWGTNPNAAEIIAKSAELFAFPLEDDSADAALLVELAPGQYSVVAGDAGDATGVAIVELYDADDAGSASTSRLINISNRGYVGVGDNIMIPGFVVSNEGPKTLLIRVVGPTLGTFGVPDVLADPTLSIYRRDFVNNTEELILTNDDWSTGPGAQRTRDVAAQVFAFALPEGSKDAAFVVTLNPGVYTVHARGANDTEGVALVEVYAVP